MNKTDMPAAEAGDSVSYELAFHVLPTVAEGEVQSVFEKLKTAITKAGANITDEEAPKRFDLAYEIIKYLEGRNRKFSSAYFGWVRFSAEPDKVEKINEVVEGTSELLRHLLIKLNKVEEEHPFRFHDALDVKRVETVGEEDEKEEKAEAKDEEAPETTEVTEADDNGEESK